MKVLSLVGLFASPLGFASNPCPSAINLEDARFLGGEKFPATSQIETNFDQVIRAPGYSGRIWRQGDLTTASGFVDALRNAYGEKGPITLKPNAIASDDSCGGKLGSYAYTYNSSTASIDFEFADENWLSIPVQDHAPVTFSISFPSNCSGCGHLAELFEFGKVTTTP